MLLRKTQENHTSFERFHISISHGKQVIIFKGRLESLSENGKNEASTTLSKTCFTVYRVRMCVFHLHVMLRLQNVV